MKMKEFPWTLVLVFLLSAGCSVSNSAQTPQECSGMSVRLRAFKLTASCNFTRVTLKEKQLNELQAATTTVLVPALYTAALVLGLPSNLLALFILLFRTAPLPSTVLLINLTVADTLLLLALPFRIAYHFNGNDWRLGEPFCRVVMAVFYGNTYGSVLCLALVALDRYVALVHPFGAKTLRGRRTSLYMTAAVWTAVLAAALPLLASRQTYALDEPRITTCHDALPEEEQQNYFLPYFATLFAACFLLPLAAVLFCHGAVLRTLLAEGKRYRHAVRVTALVLLVFVGCLLPSNLLLLLTYADALTDGDGEDLYVPYMVSLAVSTFNSVIDPFIYYYVSVEFREKAVSILRCRRGDGGVSGGNSDSSALGNKVSYASSSSGLRSKVTLLSVSSQRTEQGGSVHIQDT